MFGIKDDRKLLVYINMFNLYINHVVNQSINLLKASAASIHCVLHILIQNVHFCWLKQT